MGEAMRMNLNTLFGFFFFIILFSLIFPVTKFAHAGAPRLKDCYIFEGNERVDQEYRENLETFAEINPRRSGQGVKYTILVNPTHYYLSRETQQWLFYRQCGRINLKHNSIKDKSLRISVQEERDADCWAINQMIKERLISHRQIGRIKDDIYEIEPDIKRWHAIFGGRRSRVLTSECLDQQAK